MRKRNRVPKSFEQVQEERIARCGGPRFTRETEKQVRIGNVIRDPDGGMWIVSEVHDDGPKPTVEAISFDSENVSAVQQLNDHTRTETCNCESYDGDEYAGHDPDCENCHGAGTVMKRIKGWKHSKVLAPNVQDFILKGVKRGFGLR